MAKKIDGIMDETEKVLDPRKEEDRRRAMKLRKRDKKKMRKQRDKQSSSKVSLPTTNDPHQIIPTTEEQTLTIPTNDDQNQQQEPIVSTNNDQDQQQAQIVSTNTNQHEQQPYTDGPIDYVTTPVDLSSVDCYGPDIVQQFSDIFKHFDTMAHGNNSKRKQKPTKSSESDTTDNHFTLSRALSGKKLKAAQRYTLDELKALATVPDVVEVWDTSAMDPLLLVDLKSYRNTVPVPIHWRQRQKYLYRHRDEEKPPFVLPDFIKNTGVMEVRDNLKKQQERKRQKTKTRERRNPTLGKTDLDYQDLHDAFFLHQTEPHLTAHGDLYFERKDTVSKLKSMKPGILSDELKESLGILSTPLAPPPWLLQMQRYGPPPSYPHLKIPGLTAPIPVGAQWGLQKDGWGLIPVDGFNRPLYGGVFSSDPSPNDTGLKIAKEEPPDRTLWGELEEEQDSTDEDDENNDNDNNITDIPTNVDQPISVLDTEKVKPIRMNVGLELESGKRKRQSENSHEDPVPKLYDIIPSKRTTDITGWMGSQHTYDIPSSRSLTNTRQSWGKTQDVTVSLDPNALNDYETAVQQMYQKAQEEHMPEGVGEQELKQMYTDHAKRQAKKKRQMDIKNLDKRKDFRF